MHPRGFKKVVKISQGKVAFLHQAYPVSWAEGKPLVLEVTHGLNL